MAGSLRSRLLECAATTLCLLVIFVRPARAYIDAGTGSYILQAAIAGVLAAVIVMKSTWSRIVKAVFRRSDRRTEDGK